MIYMLTRILTVGIHEENYTSLIQSLRHQDVQYNTAGTFVHPQWGIFALSTQTVPTEARNKTTNQDGTIITPVKSSHQASGRMPTRGQYS